MPTTTFCDIKFTEDVENYTYENEEYDFSEGDVIAIPYHSANKFVNKWAMAEFANSPYEVTEEDYEDVLCKKRDSKSDDKEYCEAEKADGEVCGREKPCKYHDEE